MGGVLVRSGVSTSPTIGRQNQPGYSSSRVSFSVGLLSAWHSVSFKICSVLVKFGLRIDLVRQYCFTWIWYWIATVAVLV